VIDVKDLIRGLNSFNKVFFNKQAPVCFAEKQSEYVLASNDCSKAIDIKRNESREVNVVRLAEDYWLYVVLKFVIKDTSTPHTSRSKNSPAIFFSLSLFQGEHSDDKKTQLFRAEFDSYDTNSNHPQPHWHFLVGDNYSMPPYNFEEHLSKEKPRFDDFVSGEKRSALAMSKIHFAMCASWFKGEGHIFKAEDNKQFLDWYCGLLDHIKSQLKYLNS
jgi:hypothetical protein